MFEEISKISAFFQELQDKPLEMSKQLSAETAQTDSLFMGSNVSTPDVVQGRNFFLPDFEAENPFLSNITRSLIRNSSLDDPCRESMNYFDLKTSKNVSEGLEASEELAMTPESSGPALGQWNAEPFSQGYHQNEFFEYSEPNLFEADSNKWSLEQSIKLEEEEEEAPKLPEKQSAEHGDRGNESTTGKFSPVEKNKSEPTKKNNQIARKKIQKAKGESKQKVAKKDKKTAKDSKKKKADAKKSKEAMKESKNVVKNYGKAMAAFSLTELALPYLTRFLLNHGVTLEEYKAFIINKKETIDSISSLRDAIFGNPELDSPQDMKLKAVFRDISEVFVSDFALNWIFSCRSQYKATLLSYRFKLLRRVRDPACFTYLKSQ